MTNFTTIAILYIRSNPYAYIDFGAYFWARKSVTPTLPPSISNFPSPIKMAQYVKLETIPRKSNAIKSARLFKGKTRNGGVPTRKGSLSWEGVTHKTLNWKQNSAQIKHNSSTPFLGENSKCRCFPNELLSIHQRNFTARIFFFHFVRDKSCM